MMRITSAKIITAIDYITKETEGAYKAQMGGSDVKESGTRYIAAAQQIVYDSSLGENRAALAFFLGVMDGYGILNGEWADWRDALNTDEYAKHFDSGREDARQMKAFTTRKQQGRRVESSSQDLASETCYDGTNWATHSVEV
ncbi:hypothetical protein AB0L54_36685, partial [Streptomyces sp. NPDC052196]|uniref:hypothetical protein n=1 Tax=Streptomyces sp. NPDC052196 TaxID=3156691 RepID=UPI0034208FA5